MSKDDKVLCPFCPEGMEMFPTYNEGGVVKWACRCGAEAPVVVRKPEESVDDAAERARVLALRRYQPGNRVLTSYELENFCEANGNQALYFESRYHNPHTTSKWIDADIIFEAYGYAIDVYGKNWRCWLRKPTEEERKAVEWDG